MLKSSPPTLHSGLRRVLQLVRHLRLSAHPVSDPTLTLDMRDLEPQRSLGAQTWRKEDVWDGDGVVRWVPGCTGSANCAARRARR